MRESWCPPGVWLAMLVVQVVGCGDAKPGEAEKQAAARQSQLAVEVEQIAAALDAKLTDLDLGVWTIKEPVTFQHGVSAQTHSDRVATIGFTCQFPVTIAGETHENLVRQRGRLVFHQGSWRLQQVAVAFQFFNESEFTEESDLLAASLPDGGRLTELKQAWEAVVADTVSQQIEARKRQAEADQEAQAAKEAREQAEVDAQKARVEELSEEARLELMSDRLTKLAEDLTGQLGETLDGVDPLRWAGGANVAAQVVGQQYHGVITIRAEPRDVQLEFISIRFGRDWKYAGLKETDGWSVQDAAAIDAHFQRLTAN